jgi:hypothetical protein
MENLTAERRKRSAITRDLIAAEGGGGFPRYRAKPIITPMAVRARILEEVRDRPAEFQRRSARRRLTALDRALSDENAAIIDRAFSAWLIAHGKVKAVNLESLGVRSSGERSTVTGRELYELGLYREARLQLTGFQQQVLEHLFAALAPWALNAEVTITRDLIEAVKNTARALRYAYKRIQN